MKNKSTKTPKKPTKQEAKKKPSAFGKALNNITPYVLSVCFALTLFSQLDLAGGLGVGIKNIINGVFSSLAAYFLPMIFIYHAIVWKNDAKRKILIRRSVCSLFLLACFSTLQYLIEYKKYPELYGYSISTFYQNGVLEQGGGVVGGFLGRVLLNVGNAVIPLLIVMIVLLFMILQIFDITPASMIRGKRGESTQKGDAPTEVKPTKKQKPKNKKTPKKVEVFDDDDDDDDIVEGELGLLGTDDEVIYEDEYEEEEPEKYVDLSTDVTKRRTEKLPSQLKPYVDTTKTETKTEVSEPKTTVAPIITKEPETKTEELVVTSTVITDDETKTTEKITEVETYVKETPKVEPKITVVETEKTEVKIEPEITETKTVKIEPEITETKTVKIEPEITETKTVKIEPEITVLDTEITETDTTKTETLEFEKKITDETEITDNTVFEPLFTDEFETDDTYTDDFDTEIVDTELTTEKKKDDDFKGYMSDEALKKITPTKPEVLEVKTETVTVETEAPVKPVKPKITYKLPPTSLLQSPPVTFDEEAVLREQNENARIIVETLNSFNAKTKIVNITRGPTVTRYELMPEPGVRVRSIVALVDDIALNLAAKGIRIESPIPGKSAVGIEVPNKVVSFVYLRDLIEDSKFKSSKGKLTCALGKSISGENIYADIENTPHLLVAGATGMGKSVCINSLLVSLLYNSTPDDLRLILIDPKRVELSNYNGIPHLLVPVVCEPKKSLGALQWAVTEMENRFVMIEEAGVRNINEFNSKVEKGYNAERMPRIVIIIDELADLKMAVPDIEGHITRLTQKARAAGIHIIIGTQRPSVDVLTGLIKNNIPSRIAFRVPSQVDSRTILDEVGADKLVSKGDMLVKLVGSLNPLRVQGAYVSVDEIQEVIDYWKDLAPENYDEDVMHQIDANAAKLAKKDKEFDEDGEGVDGDDGAFDPEFYNALGIAVELGKISSSLLQRKLKLGFQRAARILDQLEECRYIGEVNGSKPRDVLITPDEYREIMMRRE